VEQAKARASRLENDHEARVQYVMGRRIVDFTSRGLRAEVYNTPPLASRYNRRMLRATEREAVRMDDQFRQSRESVIGDEIVSAVQARTELAKRTEQRLGDAIVQATSVQDRYGSAMAGAQEQLATVAVASIHHEQVADRFARLASAEIPTGGEKIALASARSWPDIPIGLLVTFSVGLIGIFLIGVSTPAAVPGEAKATGPSEEAEPVETKKYRKVAS
jgi:hypothetical protein